MVLAAGKATRLKPFSDKLPKPLFPVMGIPVAQFCFDYLEEIGIKKAVVNLHHLAEQTREGFSKLDTKIGIEFSDESQELLGTLGGIRNAVDHFGDAPFVLTDADRLADVDLASLMENHLKLRDSKGVMATLAVDPAGSPTTGYTEIELDKDQSLITGVGTKTKNKPYYLGAAVIEASFIKTLEAGRSDFVQDFMLKLIEKNALGFSAHKSQWLDIDSPDLWYQTHLDLIRRLEKNDLPERWRKRIETVSKALGPGLWADKEIKNIDPGKFSGANYLGAIQSNASSHESVVLYDSVIEPDPIKAQIRYLDMKVDF